MATVTLTWQIEGVHDGIGVYRSNQLNTGYEQIATLAPNTTVFQDEFLLSQLAQKYGTEPETLFYRLDAFRGLDVKQSDPVPVPLEDTMPEFLDGVGYLEEIPELRFGDTPEHYTYYNVGFKYLNGERFHVIFGLRTAPSLFITDPQNEGVPFTEVNQFLRNMPFDAENLEDAVAITTLAKQQAALGSAADIRMDALYPFIYREGPVFEILPTKALMDEMQDEIADLVDQESLTGYFWTSTMNPSNTNEFGQVTDIDVERFPVGGGDNSVSILSNNQAMTLTFLLIQDTTSAGV